MKSSAATIFRAFALLLLASALLPLTAMAQRRNRSVVTDPQELAYMEEMNKAIKPEFKDDVFTFARLIYQSSDYYGGGRGARDDTPDSDVCLRWRLFQITSLKVGVGTGYQEIYITPKELAGYPFAYMTATNNMELTEAEASICSTAAL